MVQVLPYVPGLGERIAPALEQAGDIIGQSLMKKRAQTALQKMEEAQSGAGVSGGSLMDQINQAANNSSPQSQFSPFSIIQKQNLVEKAYGSEAARTYAKVELEKQKLAAGEASQRRLKDYDRLEKDMEADRGKRSTIEKQRQDLKLGLDAVQTGDVGGFDLNWLADRFGKAGEPLKTAKGVQLDSVMKNLLIDSLQKTAGRPNQWIEQQIQSATPGIGKSKEANETLFAIGNANLDIEEKLLDARDALMAQYEQAGVKPPTNLDQITHQIVKPYAQQVQDRLGYDLRVIFEKSKGENYINNLQKVPKGTPLTLQKRDALMKKFNGNKEKVKEVAEKLGYTIPDPSVILRDNQEQTSNGFQ